MARAQVGVREVFGEVYRSLEWNYVPFRVFPEEEGGGDVRYDGAA